VIGIEIDIDNDDDDKAVHNNLFSLINSMMIIDDISSHDGITVQYYLKDERSSQQCSSA
jgi:hypothetical protein